MRFRTHGDPLISLLDREDPDRRFWSLVDKSAEGGCWVWNGYRDHGGYGVIGRNGKDRKAHHVAWELLRGPRPAGLVVDHLCHVRACVNPDHLEWVTSNVNGQRVISYQAGKTQCARGHPFDKANTYSHGGKRHCRVCRSEREQVQRERRRSAS